MIDAVNDDVDLAIVEQVAKGRAAAGNDYCKTSAFYRRHELKLLAVIQVVK